MSACDAEMRVNLHDVDLLVNDANQENAPVLAVEDRHAAAETVRADEMAVVSTTVVAEVWRRIRLNFLVELLPRGLPPELHLPNESPDTVATQAPQQIPQLDMSQTTLCKGLGLTTLVGYHPEFVGVALFHAVRSLDVCLQLRIGSNSLSAQIHRQMCSRLPASL